MVGLVLTVASVSPLAANCATGAPEQFRYDWRLRGAVRLLAGFVFPTSGIANLRTVARGGDGLHSELLITAPSGKAGGFYAYESQIDSRRATTITTYHGYSWGSKSRNERTVFDYSNRVARVRRTTPEKVEDKIKKLPDNEQEFRDILTAIWFLRQNAGKITAPMTTSIYSDGTRYPVIFRPGERKNFTVGGKPTPAREFEIADAPGGKKWPGGVTVWVTEDERRMPVRIIIKQSIASLQLDLRSAEGCGMIALL